MILLIVRVQREASYCCYRIKFILTKSVDIYGRHMGIYNHTHVEGGLFMKKYHAFIIFLATCSILLTGCDASKQTPFSYESQEQIVNEHIDKSEELSDAAYDSFEDKTESIYNKAFEEYVKRDTVQGNDIPWSKRLLKAGYGIYSNIRAMAPLIFLGSIGIGTILILASRHNKATRKLGWYGFIFGIPTLLLLFVFGVGILNDMFLF